MLNATATRPNINAIAPWFGGKRRLAPQIVEELGPHSAYFEPFCGGMAVLLAKPASNVELVNDLHGDLINLARVVADPSAGPLLYDRLQRTLMTDPLLRAAQSELVDCGAPLPDWPLDVTEQQIQRAYWYFITSWMGRNGVAGTDRMDYQLAVRWNARGGGSGRRFGSVVDSIPRWHERLRQVTIVCRDAFSIIPKFDDASSTVIYVDAPYAAETRSKMMANHGSGRYLHEFDHQGGDLFGREDDHSKLARLLHSFRKARIVFSTYPSDRIRGLYPDWTLRVFKSSKIVQKQRGSGAEQNAPEWLLMNGPSVAG